MESWGSRVILREVGPWEVELIRYSLPKNISYMSSQNQNQISSLHQSQNKLGWGGGFSLLMLLSPEINVCDLALVIFKDPLLKVP